MIRLVRVVRDIQLVGHHLPEGRAGPLATVGLADMEDRGTVLANDDPGIELSEVGVGIGTAGLGRGSGLSGCSRGEWTGDRGGTEADDEHARTLEEAPPGDGSVQRVQELLHLCRNARGGRHATPPVSAAAPAAVIDVAARLMAA